jgi:hypothetical protein
VSISGDLRDDFKRSSSNLEDKLSDLQKQDRENVQRLAAMEVKVEQQERKIAELFAENERLRRVTASQVPLSTPPTPHILELTTSHASLVHVLIIVHHYCTHSQFWVTGLRRRLTEVATRASRIHGGSVQQNIRSGSCQFSIRKVK